MYFTVAVPRVLAQSKYVILQTGWTTKFKDYFSSFILGTISTLITRTKGWTQASCDHHKSVHSLTNESAPTNLLYLERVSLVSTRSESQVCPGSCFGLFQTVRPTCSMVN